MSEFFNLLPPQDALRLLTDRLVHRSDQEVVATRYALGRVTTGDIISPEDLPAFPRSTMDGYSVRAADTFGATEGLPAYLEVIGEVPMGQMPCVEIGLGRAAKAFTGGMLAKGANAVVMVENTQALDDHTIEVMRPVAPGENVLQTGEDVCAGSNVLSKGHVLRAQDVGGLMALGITSVEVAAKPKVSIVSTGSELVAPGQSPALGEVRDVNTYTISGLVEAAGGSPIPIALVEDNYEVQCRVAKEGLARGDVLIFSAGSSVSARDMTAEVIGSLGKPGILVHGLAHKPGKPAVVAMIEGKPVFGLPGNPVSAMVVFDLLVRPAIYALTGCSAVPLKPSVRARLTRDVPSESGREDHVQVKLQQQSGICYAEPVFGKSNLIYTLVRADGSVTVPLEKGGLYAGEEVDVSIY